jgi:hypothetical protein
MRDGAERMQKDGVQSCAGRTIGHTQSYLVIRPQLLADGGFKLRSNLLEFTRIWSMGV